MRRWIAFLELVVLVAFTAAPVRAPEWGRAVEARGVVTEPSPRLEREAVKSAREASSTTATPRADLSPPFLGPLALAPVARFSNAQTWSVAPVARARDQRGDVRRTCPRRVPPEEPPEAVPAPLA